MTEPNSGPRLREAGIGGVLRLIAVVVVIVLCALALLAMLDVLPGEELFALGGKATSIGAVIAAAGALLAFVMGGRK